MTQANHGSVDYIPTSTPEEVVEKIKNGESKWIEEVQIKKEAPDDPPSRTPCICSSTSITGVSIQSDQLWSEATCVQCQRHLRCYTCSDHFPQRKVQLPLHKQDPKHVLTEMVSPTFRSYGISSAQIRACTNLVLIASVNRTVGRPENEQILSVVAIFAWRSLE